MSQNYKGLLNSGATCYMNSLLQTLFMNSEFRKGILDWKYNPEVDVKEEDCILYQLQLLMGKLKSEEYKLNVDTHRLTKSFQWNSQMNYEQQDIQEFCRILFDVIDTTLAQGFIARMFQGTVDNYVQCHQCSHLSSRNEHFLDLQLTVRNKYEQIYNSSLWKMLQSYLKPETLDKDNQYWCNKCESRQDATKGVAFKALPRYFQIIMNRFEFDLVYMKRDKLTDAVTFPFVLNMNDYMNGYHNIKNKQSEDINQTYFNQQNNNHFPGNNNGYYHSNYNTNNNNNNNNLKLEKKRSVQSNSSKQSSVSQKAKPSRNTTSFISEMRKKKLQQAQTEEIEIVVNQKDYVPIQQPDIQIPPIPPKEQAPPQQQKDMIQEQQQEQETELKQEEKKKSFQELKQEKEQLIQEYKKEGEQVFVLESVLIHKGGAYGGHYYTYIADGERWLEFNDNSVREVEDLKQMVEDCTHNGYMFNYARIDAPQTLDTPIPDYIHRAIQVEMELHDLQKQKVQFAKDVMNLRVYYKLQSQLIACNKQDTYKYLLLTAINLFHIKDSLSNVRLRLYDVDNDLMLNTYTNKDQFTLGQLKINAAHQFCLEVKQPQEEFTQYNPDNIFIHFEAQQHSTKDFIHLDTTLEQAIHSQFPQQHYIYVYIRLNQGSKQSMSQQHLQSTLRSLNYLQGQTLYLEQESEKGIWNQQLEEENNTIYIKYNQFDVDSYDNLVKIDGRKSIQDLREAIMKQEGLEDIEIILKRGNKLGAELKEEQKSIQETNIINYGQIYIERGQPCRKDQVRVSLYKATPTCLQDDHFYFTFSLLGTLVVDTKHKGHQVIHHIQQLYPTHFPSGTLLRLQEKMGERLTRVYDQQVEMGKQGVMDRKFIGVRQVDKVSGQSTVHVWVRLAKEDYSMTDRVELALPRTSTLDQVAELFSAHYPYISTLNFMLTRIINITSFNKYTLSTLDWIHLQGDSKITAYPLFIQDGMLLILKEKLIQFNEIDPETAKLNGIKKPNFKLHNNKIIPKYQPSKEKSIKILIKTKEQENENMQMVKENVVEVNQYDGIENDIGPLF